MKEQVNEQVRKWVRCEWGSKSARYDRMMLPLESSNCNSPISPSAQDPLKPSHVLTLQPDIALLFLTQVCSGSWSPLECSAGCWVRDLVLTFFRVEDRVREGREFAERETRVRVHCCVLLLKCKGQFTTRSFSLSISPSFLDRSEWTLRVRLHLAIMNG